ncbi:hypothetical protein BSU04_17535 [Caballeronia sordidicola]|jgi:hypothetical protein|uniref:Uncharacterized protein n=1 Tax=Caballeronia sordidicola TaxID=196367 RepID=A0A226X2U7_CABSO|nr:hypothetical protein BSU04_17535 [Caballeronia sordidicola]
MVARVIDRGGCNVADAVAGDALVMDGNSHKKIGYIPTGAGAKTLSQPIW